MSAEEFKYIKAGGGGTGHTLASAGSDISWGSLFSPRSVWGLILGYFCATWTWNTFVVFLPMYLLHEFNISLTKMGFYASVPWIGGAVGSVCSGFIAARAAKRFRISPLKANQRLATAYAAFAALPSPRWRRGSSSMRLAPTRWPSSAPA